MVAALAVALRRRGLVLRAAWVLVKGFLIAIVITALFALLGRAG